MCSFIFTNKTIQNLEKINKFTKYRGPDQTNSVVEKGYTFIHNLLSITGSFTPQPISSEDKNIFCLFNGEIYNFPKFSDFDNDSQCLIPAYEKYGHSFSKQLDGEFAILLVDFLNKEIIVSTDVFGTKPLWIASEDGHFGAASYASALLELGFTNPQKIKANTTLVFNLQTHELKKETSFFEFDIENQSKTNFYDWQRAFQESIFKRAISHVREKIFIGLSSGYDSGAIACELLNQQISFKAYTSIGTENQDILYKRYEKIKTIAEIEAVAITPEKRNLAYEQIKEKVEPFTYNIYSASSTYRETIPLHNDHGSSSLAYIALCAKRDGRKIYLSGQGADEIFADYGFAGTKICPHSNFGGLFPQNLRDIFPWPSFYESSQSSYLAKEEYIAGAYGLEARYPYLDPKVVQEFLWLSVDLKNKYYKSVLHDYFLKHDFPFAPNQKIGF